MTKTRLSIAVAASLLLATIAAAEPAPLRVVTWNLEHFVDPYDDPYVQNPMEDEGEWKNDRALVMLAQSIVALDADVLALQEVEGDRAVKLFLDTFVPDHGYKYFACVPSIEWYQNVVVASRHPLGPITSWREVEMFNPVNNRTENKYNARLMAVEVRAPGGYTFDLVNVHLKAGGDDDNPVWRTLQIELLQEWFARQVAFDPQRNIMVVGDFNMVPGSAEYEVLVNGDRFPLFDPAKIQGYPPTHPSTSPRRRIDMALFNQAMAPEYIPGSLAVAQPLPLVDLARLSDHLPVVVSIHPENRDAAE